MTAGVSTIRKRRLPLESLMWCIIGMALFRRMSAWNVVKHMDIMLPGKRPLVAPSAVVQGRQRLGSEPFSSGLAYVGEFAPLLTDGQQTLLAL